MEPRDEEGICGETFDHKCLVTYEDDTIIQWHCLICGAEGEDLKEAPDGQDV